MSDRAYDVVFLRTGSSALAEAMPAEGRLSAVLAPPVAGLGEVAPTTQIRAIGPQAGATSPRLETA